MARLFYETRGQIDQLLRSGLRLDSLVTHELPLERFDDAIDLMQQAKCSKCLLIP